MRKKAKEKNKVDGSLPCVPSLFSLFLYLSLLGAPPDRVADHGGSRSPLALHRPEPDFLLQLPVGSERRDRLARAVVEDPRLGEDAEAREAEEDRWWWCVWWWGAGFGGVGWGGVRGKEREQRRSEVEFFSFFRGRDCEKSGGREQSNSAALLLA